VDLKIRGRPRSSCGGSKAWPGCAASLRGEGCRVTLVARERQRWKKPRMKSAPSRARRSVTVAADITSEQGRIGGARRLPEPDILVTNAGGPPPGDFPPVLARRLAEGAGPRNDHSDPSSSRRQWME